MLCYSDFILSKQPWSYCRLDEPVGYHLYHDISGNRNHLYSTETEGEYEVSATNRQAVNLLGDPFIGGIRPLIANQTLVRDAIDDRIPDTALRFRVPEFKSDTIIYRRREKIQNPLDISFMWIDFLMDPHIGSYQNTMKNWMASAPSFTGAQMNVDHLFLTGEFDHINGITGSRMSDSLSYQKQLYTLNETFLVFGSLALVGVTGVHYSSSGAYLGYTSKLMLVIPYFLGDEKKFYTVWSKTLVTIDPVHDPVEVLSAGLHRFTLGISDVTTSSMTVTVSFDGGVPQVIQVDLPDDQSLAIFDHEIYSRIAILNDTVFSSVSVFFNQPFPSNDWLTASQTALTRPYRAPVAEDWSILRNYPMIEKLPGSLFNAMNAVLLLGTNHRLLSRLTFIFGTLTARIEPATPGVAVGNTIKINKNKQSPFSGCWSVNQTQSTVRVRLNPVTHTQIPATITVGATDYDRSYHFTDDTVLIGAITKTPHHFSIGDMVTIHQITDVIQPHSWLVTAVDADGFTVQAQGVSGDYDLSDNGIIKQTPCGGGCWTKTFSDNRVGFGYLDIEAAKKNILIDDRQSLCSEVFLSNPDNTDPSENLYIPKDIKNTLNKEKDRIPSKAVGDCHRLYWFVSAKQNTVSHTSIIVFGEIWDLFNNDWCSVAIVSSRNSKDQNTGFNYAFLYPDWSIHPDTGFLICRSFKSHASDGQIRLIDGAEITSSLGYGDSGQHVYPINIPYITFVP